MQAHLMTREVGVGRTLVGIVALAAALASGSFAAAAPGEGTDTLATAGCGASAVSAAVSPGAPGVEWSSSRTAPGKPY